LRHQENLLKGKLVPTVFTGCDPEALATVNKALAREVQEYENLVIYNAKVMMV